MGQVEVICNFFKEGHPRARVEIILAPDKFSFEESDFSGADAIIRADKPASFCEKVYLPSVEYVTCVGLKPFLSRKSTHQ